MKFIYSAKMLAFLRANYPKLSVEQLADAFNRKFDQDKTPGQIKSTCKNHRIKCYRSTGESNRGKRLLFTESQIDFLKVSFPSMSRLELTAALNAKFQTSFKPSQVIAFTKNHGITSGRTGHFKKGQVPFNAGTKGLMKRNSGTFNKGNTPHNHVPVGSTTVDTEGYHKTKVAEPNVWEHTHRMLYEKTHGPIPKTCVVVFIDGDRSNVVVENLELIDRGDLAVMNKIGMSSLPVELRPIGKTLVKLRRKTSELQRERRRSA